MKKVALIGGAFDPITIGHLQLAEVVLKHVDEVRIMPCFDHAYGKQMASAGHRHDMGVLAVVEYFWAGKGNFNVQVSDFEIINKTTATYDTFKKLRADNPADYHFVIGQDNADTIDKWYNYEELLKTTKFIVVPRKGYTSSETWYRQEPHLYLEDESIVEISSTQVRELLKANESAEKFLTKKVQEYIKEYELYS